MKATGITRPVDELGRVVLPKELRDSMDIVEDDRMEIFVEGNAIVLRKYQPGCIICDSMDDLKQVNGHNFCGKCCREISGA